MSRHFFMWHGWPVFYEVTVRKSAILDNIFWIQNDAPPQLGREVCQRCDATFGEWIGCGASVR